MDDKYEVVPNVVSSKDLDYLSDMFNWNYDAYKCAYNAMNNTLDNEIKAILGQAVNLFNDNMCIVLNILKNGGCNE